MSHLSTAALTAALLLAAMPARAADTIAVQGLLRDSNGQPLSQTTFSVTFRIWSAQTGGTTLFTQPAPGLAVDKGVFDADLGPLPANLFSTNPQSWLEIQVDGEAPLPRTPVRWVPYALHAARATAADSASAVACSGCITSSHVSTNAVTTSAMQPQSVTAAKIAPGAIESLGFVKVSNLADVALSGSYLDLINAPDLSAYARKDATNIFTQPQGFTGQVTASGGLLVAGGSADLTAVVTKGLRLEGAGSAPATCNPSAAGRMYFDTGAKLLQVCDGAAWKPVGAAGARAVLSTSPAATDFGKTTSPSTKTITLTNVGDTAATALTLAATPDQGFAVASTTCGGTLGPAASCTATITFNPAGLVAGAHAGALSVESSNAASAVAVLSATAGVVVGNTPSTAAESCLAILQAGQTTSGIYWIAPSAGGQSQPFQVYCDQTTDGGGWALILNQLDGTYYTILSRNAVLTSPQTPGGHAQIQAILSNAAEIRYADTSNTEILHAAIDGPTYWAALQGTASVAVPVTYMAGPLSGKERYIEVRDNFHWGHRHNVPYVNGVATNVLDVYSASCLHTCWEDVNLADRLFAGDHCPSATSASFCPGTSPVYSFPGTSTRGGSFTYRKWVRAYPISSGPGTSAASAGTSCDDLLQSGVTQSGAYWIKPPGATAAFRIYCDQATLGGGWMLVLSQISSTYQSLTSQNADLVSPSVAGGQKQIFTILPNITQIRYTDEAGTTFLNANIDGPAYAAALQQGASRAVEVTYLAGPLSGKTRYIEVRNIFHWGHRNNTPTVDGKPTAANDVYNDGCHHVCWEDTNTADRVFAGDHCPSASTPSFCPATGAGYTFPSTATRGGSFNYRKWVR